MTAAWNLTWSLETTKLNIFVLLLYSGILVTQ